MQVSFHYDEMNLVRLLFDVFIDKPEFKNVIQTKNKRWAFYDLREELSDEDISESLSYLAEKKGYKEITFEDFEGDFSTMVSYLIGTEKFRNLYLKRVSNVNYEFEENKGVCGILLVDGTFLKCYEMEHSLRSESLDREDLNFAIYFSSKMNYGEWGDSVFRFDLFNKENLISEKQRIWFDENYKYFDKGQKYMADIYLD